MLFQTAELIFLAFLEMLAFYFQFGASSTFQISRTNNDQ